MFKEKFLKNVAFPCRRVQNQWESVIQIWEGDQNSFISRHCCQPIAIFIAAFMCKLVKWCHFGLACKSNWYSQDGSRRRREKILRFKYIFLDLGTRSSIFLIFQTSQNLTLFLTVPFKILPIILPRSQAIIFLPSCLKSYPRVSESYRLATVSDQVRLKVKHDK